MPNVLQPYVKEEFKESKIPADVLKQNAHSSPNKC